ncbi:YcaO-like family protein [Halodesulfurarchaeum sp.]|uniref:YcaO-like family protein n=1 Tax=Halodesulfurarchaeum sp. TaxID=1980530 RepID=UPI001BBE9D17|nr:YcaO-like family protein [Halodesulfurarchaeum sp.]
MAVLLIGEGPAVESAEAMLADSDVDVARGSMNDLPAADLAIVVGLAGSEGFETANEQAIESDTPWIAVELGGIGGVPMQGLSATITTLQPGYVCYDCLRSRVEANDVHAADEATAERPAARLAGSYAGIQAIRAFSGAQVAGVVVEVPYAERSLLPVPKCEHAPERDRSLELDDIDRTLDEALEQAEMAVGDRLGIVPLIGEHDSFPLPYYLASVTETTSWSDGNAPDRAAGVAQTWDGAFMKALGESLERYSAAMYRTDDLERQTPDEIDGPAPDSFVSVRDGYPESADSWKMPVVQGLDLQTEDSVTLPADLVFYPPPEGTIGQAITTGLGLGSGGVDAVLSGLYEVIERDATMLSWYSSFEPLGLEVPDSTFDSMVERARGNGLSVTPLLITQDVDVPVVAVAVSRDEYPRFALGSAADLDAEAAAIDALSEALQNWMELRDLGPEEASEAGGEIGAYAKEPGAASSMASPEETVPATAVGPETVPAGRAELDALLDRMDAAGLDTYAASVTSRDVERLGFTAVRVLSPSAQPLFVDEPVFGDRARMVPEDLGFEPRLDRAFHPYP